ncbi:dihydrodipicolinate synthase family protein [Achromobacter insolitus]|uniref:dihydrodipicolinate synthase family protein n=1 Tax=Achromobacter insolitus TaxID=217204 RepID=UPI0007C6D7CA|nr:dihydrodipicolinate synthase family protein [Achromobacter insolitus]OAE54103.1 dihydrodipicolinate synthase family protein [Achromobacter insolitus]OCZ59373.1 dihydrodipicolinate synthase family protein [Achromobacter insolitus]
MHLKGIIGYLLTPCDESGGVDHALLEAHVERLIGEGVHALAPLGSVGCLPYLDDGEREAVIDTVIGAARGRVPVLAGVSSLSTASTVRHARYAERAGAAALQLLPSTYWKLTQDEILAYYREVCESVSAPVMVYNNPFTTGMDLSVEFLARLAELPNVTMIKESSPDPTKIARLRAACPAKTAVYIGLNCMARTGFAEGAAGWCTASANISASHALNLYRCATAGDARGADEWFARQIDLLNFLMGHGLPRTVAAGLQLRGFDPGRLRAPLAPLAAEPEQRLLEILKKMEIVR